MKYLKIIFVILAATLLSVGIYVLIRYQHTSDARPKDRYTGHIRQVKSSVDADRDGIDDQTDILQNALSYIQTKPKYKSKYYTSGYPDDEYGVCTDVVANALKHAGYDLQMLVMQDIQNNPDAYQMEKPDIHIDFRRVKNLKRYFSHTAIKLTNDTAKTEEWQGGDIVIFQKHIGIVSDRRNQNGVPYVIHHEGPFQKAYEQDILETRSDIVGHYRISE